MQRMNRRSSQNRWRGLRELELDDNERILGRCLMNEGRSSRGQGFWNVMSRDSRCKAAERWRVGTSAILAGLQLILVLVGLAGQRSPAQRPQRQGSAPLGCPHPGYIKYPKWTFQTHCVDY